MHSDVTFFPVGAEIMDHQQIMSEAWRRIVDRVRELQKQTPKVTYEAIGKMCGVSKPTVQRWDKDGQGGEKTAFSDMLRYLEALGISISSIIEGIPDSEFDYVRKVKAQLGAGASLVTSGEDDGRYAFRKHFLRSVLNVPTKNLVLFDVVGDSMEPVLRQGDTVLVDTSCTKPHDGEIFAIRVGKELMVKRVSFEPGFMVCKSDNERAGQFRVSTDEDGQEDFGVIGKVRWMGRVF